MQVSDLMGLQKGSTVALNRRIGEPVDVVVNGRRIARGGQRQAGALDHHLPDGEGGVGQIIGLILDHRDDQFGGHEALAGQTENDVAEVFGAAPGKRDDRNHEWAPVGSGEGVAAGVSIVIGQSRAASSSSQSAASCAGASAIMVRCAAGR